LKAKDATEHTVIGLQVENEPNITEQDHDYAPEAMAVFNSAVPAQLVSAMKAAGKGDVYDAWKQAGGKESGIWLSYSVRQLASSLIPGVLLLVSMLCEGRQGRL